jgi:hypothetical protein
MQFLDEMDSMRDFGIQNVTTPFEQKQKAELFPQSDPRAHYFEKKKKEKRMEMYTTLGSY